MLHRDVRRGQVVMFEIGSLGYDGLYQIARLIYVHAVQNSGEIGKELERHNLKQGQEKLAYSRNRDRIIT